MNKSVSKFRKTKIYFLRIVRRLGDKRELNEKGYINILGKEIILGNDLINLFTFSTVDILKGTISINIENEEGKLLEIKSNKFQIKNIIECPSSE